jgi:hypothetical protein
MDAFAAELQACLVELEHGSTAAATLIRPPDTVRDRAGLTRRRGLHRPFLVAGLVLVLLAVTAAVWALRGNEKGRTDHGAPPSAKLSPVKLAAAGSYDPQGTGGEHDSKVPLAVDGNPATYWDTEHYRSFTKRGVGFVLRLPKPTAVRKVVLTTATPGFEAEIRGGDSSSGPFPILLSAARIVAARTGFTTSGRRVGFLLVWITKLQPGSDVSARVNEVRGFA